MGIGVDPKLAFGEIGALMSKNAPLSKKKVSKNAPPQNKFDIIQWLSKKSTVSKQPIVSHIAQAPM